MLTEPHSQVHGAPPPPEAPDLMIVIPVFNERASIRKVVMEWHHEVLGWTEHFRILVVDDGSTDSTPQILEAMRTELGERLQVISQRNAGHGQACMNGYRTAIREGANFLLQIDSDGQCDPQYFFKFWRMREEYDVIYGVRRVREDGWKRVLASWMLKLFILIFARVHCRDANVPYRLMRASTVRPFVEKFPSMFYLANIGLSVLLKKVAHVRHGYVPIRFRERYGGEPHVPLAKFGAKAFELRSDLARLPLDHAAL